jgi:predicted DNA-binding transcriptional regulator AlpA
VDTTPERPERPAPSDLITAGDIRAALGVSRNRAYAITTHYRFPTPWYVSRDGTVRLWIKAEVGAYFDANRPDWGGWR